jgi:tetratricopeptide (TPR) repeat protein
MERRIKSFLSFVWLTSLFFCGSISAFPQRDGEDVAIGKYHVIHSNVLHEDRTLLVHLPRGYEDGKRRYPVLYMLYGDHVTTYFAEAVSILDTLGPTGRIPDCLLVGIMNSDRYRDLLPLTPDGKPTGIENFTGFLQSEVFPFIDQHYRTKDFRILIGPQAGANYGLFTLFQHPDMFAALIINHPFRWQGGRDLILKTAEDFFNRETNFKKFVFITYDDTDALAREGVGNLNRFSEIVQTKRPAGFALALNFMAGHDEFLQRLGLREGLKKLFEDYPFPEDRKAECLDDVLSFYRELSGKIGFEVDPPEHVLTVQGDHLLELGKTNEVMKILEFAMERYPMAANSYFRMANLLSQVGNLERARDYMKKAVELVPQDSGMLRSRLTAMEKKIDASAAYQVEKAIRSDGIKTGINKYQELLANPQPPIYFDESEFNDLGYRLMQSGNLAGALQVFLMNVALYPGSANAHDSLGECYMRSGENEKAVASYKKSLEIDPQNQNALEMLKKLREINPHRQRQ